MIRGKRQRVLPTANLPVATARTSATRVRIRRLHRFSWERPALGGPELCLSGGERPNCRSVRRTRGNSPRWLLKPGGPHPLRRSILPLPSDRGRGRRKSRHPAGLGRKEIRQFRSKNRATNLARKIDTKLIFCFPNGPPVIVVSRQALGKPVRRSRERGAG